MTCNPAARKAALRDAEGRLAPRFRVCSSCINLDSDTVIGRIHSEKPCERCGDAPCFGAVVEVWPKSSRARIKTDRMPRVKHCKCQWGMKDRRKRLTLRRKVLRSTEMNPSTLPLTIKVVRPHYKVIGPAVMDHDRAHYDVDHGPSAEALRQELWFRTQEREAYGPSREFTESAKCARLVAWPVRSSRLRRTLPP